MAFEGTDQLLKRTQNFVDEHRALYLRSAGREGHIVDLTHAGSRGRLPTLLLRSTGRRSGRLQIVPLIYGLYGDEWVVIGSKGGAPDHPAWYLNLTAASRAAVQVATQAFEVDWRIAEGDEREAVWAYMQQVYPPYADYQAAAQGRTIPVILFRLKEEIAPFSTDPAP